MEMLAYIKENHLSLNECDNLIEFYKKNSEQAKLFRSNFPLPLRGQILEKVKNYLEPMSLTLNNSILDWSDLVYWPKKSYQDLHKDFASAHTTLSSITYLNDNFIGGITYFQDGTQFAPVKGRTVFFDGQYFNHGVTPIFQGERYTLATWYKKNSS
jgi:hypothetical protein